MIRSAAISAPNAALPQPVVALSLNVLRRRVAALRLPDVGEVVLSLDKAAKTERDARRQGGPIRAGDHMRG